MALAHDVRVNLLMLVGLLNSDPVRAGGEDGLASPEAVSTFAGQHEFSGPLAATAFDVAAVTALRERCGVTLTGDVDAVVEAINQTFSEIRAFPRLVRHDDWDWHLHAAGESAPLSERMAFDVALVLTDLVRAGELDRLRVCAAEDCSAALADLTKKHSKRFCDVGNCANRTHIANYRARQSHASHH